MNENTGKKTASAYTYRLLRWLVRLFYPRITLEGLENLPEEPCLLVGNHAQMNGPIACQLYIPGRRAIWCTSEMMHRKEVPAYAYRDFWSEKPRAVRWFYKLLSYLIAPVAACIFNEADTIAVYHDDRIVKTFRETVEKLEAGCRVVVFPEGPEPGNHIVDRFQDGFVDVGRLYGRRTGKALPFVPMYVAPRLRKICLGKPVYYDLQAPRNQERRRITQSLMDAVTEMAVALPRHTVVPYRNIPKRDYPTNLPPEVELTHEKTCR